MSTISSTHETTPLRIAFKAVLLFQGALTKRLWQTGSPPSWFLLFLLLIYWPPEPNSVTITILKGGLLFRLQNGVVATRCGLPQVGSALLWVILFAGLYSYLNEITQVLPLVAAFKAWLLFFHLQQSLGMDEGKPPPMRDKVPTIRAPDIWRCLVPPTYLRPPVQNVFPVALRFTFTASIQVAMWFYNRVVCQGDQTPGHEV